MVVPEISDDLLVKAMDYDAYKALFKNLVSEGKTTGPEQTGSRGEYTRLNLARMNRLEKTFLPTDAAVFQLAAMPGPLIFLTITEAWCGDAAQIIPIVDHLIGLRPDWKHKLVLRDEQPALMDKFLTSGKSRSIPITIILDANTFQVLGSWGPRPYAAQELIDAQKATDTPPDIIKANLHGWYTKDKGRQIAEEFLARLMISLMVLRRTKVVSRQEAA